MSLLDLSILGILADQPLHGYELKKRLGELVDGRPSVSFGSLYPALNRLDRDGFIRSGETNTADRVPMTGSLGAEVAALQTSSHETTPHSRRTRKVYTITSEGKARLVSLLIVPPTDDRTFAVQLAFCKHLDPSQRLTLLHHRRADLVGRLAAGENTSRLRDRYRSAARDRDRLTYESELVWLDHLIDEEQALLDEIPSPDHVPNSSIGGSPL